MISRNRKIHIIGEIDHEAYLKFTRKMDRLEEESNEEIHIVLMSDGGDGQVALAFYDRIRMSPCVVSITGVGIIASAAALILVAPRAIENRSMTQNSWVMVHDENTGKALNNTRVVHATKNLKQLQRFEDQWNHLMATSTNVDEQTWKSLHENETYITAEMCKELGIIGGVI